MFSTFTQRRVQMTALMLPLPTEATIEEKATLGRSDAVLRTIDDHKLFKKILIHASRQIIINTDGVEETGNYQMVRGHWITDIYYNRSDLYL